MGCCLTKQIQNYNSIFTDESDLHLKSWTVVLLLCYTCALPQSSPLSNLSHWLLWSKPYGGDAECAWAEALSVRPGPAPRGGIRGPCPPKRVTVPPTFHPLPSLLNVIDFESESETDKTAHIRKHENSVINYSPSYRSKPLRPLFIFGTQIKIFLMKSESFLTLGSNATEIFNA